MLELYKNIKEIRTEKGMTQKELAEKIGYTDRSIIAKIEKGEVDLLVSKLLLFAKALDVSPIELLGNISKSDSELYLTTKYNRLNNKGQNELMEYLGYLLTKEELKKIC